jgi:sulfur dioxygenase
VHADHITSTWLLHKSTGSKTALSGEAGAEGLHRSLGHSDKIKSGKHFLMVRATPGHTKGCLTFVLETEKMAFVGDCLLIRGCERTDFQGGDAAQMYRSIESQIFTLLEDCLLYPCHDFKGLTSTCAAEKKSFNPRLGGQLCEKNFIVFMNNLSLDYPNKTDIAVPGNLKCGRPDENSVSDDQPGWAELTLTFAGFWEVQPHWLAENPGVAQILDVREADEFNGTLGRTVGAIPIALSNLKKCVDELDKQRPIDGDDI